MGTLYFSRIMPNPMGKDSAHGTTTNAKLNEEWVELTAGPGGRNLSGDTLLHRTYSSYGCTLTGTEALVTLTGEIAAGEVVRIHTGAGQQYTAGAVHHVFLGRPWFVWNNRCGDEAVLAYQNQAVDRAAYAPSPPERVLNRAPGTNRFL